MRSNRLAGHELPDEGRVYENGIYPVQQGVGVCSCGEKSQQSLPSANARKKWHRDHKNDILSKRGLNDLDARLSSG